jgi:hypothetical protein
MWRDNFVLHRRVVQAVMAPGAILIYIERTPP